MRSASSCSASTLGVILFLAGSFPVHAAGQAIPSQPAQSTTTQDAPTASPEPAVARTGSDQAGDIIVTGSRISRRDYTSSSPIVTVNPALIQSTGAPTLESSLNTLPQLTPSAGAASNTATRGGQANLDLRGIGQQRTLVLIDGRRVQPSGSDGTVDLNIIPSNLIENVEVITGGASSTYGSDAIAGVVNLKLRKRFTGLEIDGQSGVSERGDGDTQDISALAGTNFADDRGNAYLAVDYAHRGSVGYIDRSFLSHQALSQNLPSALVNVVGTNLPSQAVVNATFARYGIAPGTVARSAVLSANADGTLFTQAGAINYRGSTSSPLSLYNGSIYNSAGDTYYAQIPLDRYSVAGHATFKITPSLEFFADGLYTHYTVSTSTNPVAIGSSSSKTLVIPVTNPFIPAALSTILASRPNPTTPISVVQALFGLGNKGERDEYDVYQLTAGLNGRIGGSDITWTIYGSYGRTRQDQNLFNFASSAAYQTLASAADGGRSICTGGYNPFVGDLSSSCQDYVRRSAVNTTVLDQRVVEASAQGKVLDLPAGELRFAVGADYRRNSYSFAPDAKIAAGDIANFLPIQASRGAASVYEGFGELLVPLIHNTPLIRELSVDLGYRYSNYDTVGGINTYKADVDWKVFDVLRLRGGYARATRAPSVGELFAASSQGQTSLGNPGIIGQGDPCDIRGAYRAAGSASAAQVRSLCLAQGIPATIIDTFINQQTRTPYSTGGNANLRAESTDTYSVGAVLRSGFSSPWLSGLSASIDYYSIKLKSAIGLVTNTVATGQCFSPDANPGYANSNYYCQLLTRDPNSGQLIQIQNPLLNLGGYSTSGIDIQADWTVKLDDVGAKGLGTISLNTVFTHLNTFQIKTLPTGATLEYAGTIGNVQVDQFADAHPRWKGTSGLTWKIGKFQASGRWRYIGPMSNANNVGTGGTAHGVPAVSYFDLDAAINVSSRFTLRAGIVNLGDKAPPVLNDSYIGAVATDIYTYDLVGRRFFMSFQAKF